MVTPARLAPALFPSPGLRSRYAPLTPTPSGRFGHRLERRRSLSIAGTGERDKTGGSQRRLFDRRIGMLLEQALEPARGDSRVATRILPCDQHGQLEPVEQAYLRQFLGRCHRRKNVPALNRLLEDPVRVALRGRRSSSAGPDGSTNLIREMRRANVKRSVSYFDPARIRAPHDAFGPPPNDHGGRR